MSKTEIKKAENETKDVALASMMDDFESQAGAGVEQATADDMAVPYLRLAQSNSPQVNDTKPEYIDGLKVGDFYLTSDGSIFPKSGVTMIPCYFRTIYIEWTPRTEGADQSFVAIYDEQPADAQDNGKGGLVMPNGNICAKTAEWYMLVIDADGFAQQCVVSLASTQYKKSRNLMSLIKKVRVQGRNGMFNPPSYFNVLKVTSVPESNSQGDWRGWKFELAGKITDREDAADLTKFARDTYEAVSNGTKRAAQPSQADSSGAGVGNTETGGFTGNSSDLDDDIPF